MIAPPVGRPAATPASPAQGTPASERAARGPTTILAVAVVLGLIAVGLAAFIPSTGADDDAMSRLSVVAFVVGMTGLTATGAVLLQRDPDHRLGRWLVAAGLAGVLSRLVSGYAVASGPELSAAVVPVLWATNWVWVPAQVCLLELLLRFPDGRLPARSWRPVHAVLLLWGIVATGVTALLPGPLGSEALSHLDNPYGLDVARPVLDAALGPLFATLPVLTVACAAALAWRWARSDGLVRQQLRWLAAAAVCIAVLAPFAVLGGVTELAAALSFVLLPAAAAVAVLRHGLWDLGTVIRRTLVHAVGTVVLAGLYLAAVLLVDSRATPVLAALGVAVLALPVRRLAQRGLERVLFGARGDPDRVVASVSTRLTGTTEPVLDGVLTDLARSLRLPYLAVETPDGQVLAATGRPTGEAVRLAMRARAELVGWLSVHARAPGEGLGPRDTELLERVAQQAGLAVHAAQLDADLRSSHTRLLAIRDEERSRLQRDLHDGLGPSLAGISMQAEAARNLVAVGASADEVDGVLARIGVSTESAVHEVRRIIDDLRPSSLERHGLRGALVAAAGTAGARSAVELRIAATLPAVNPEVEVAVYQIALEALRNVRHAAAERCRLVLEPVDDELLLEVRDDGTGLGDAEPGVGLRSMRERAARVGAELTIEPGAETGTIVRARFPVGRPPRTTPSAEPRAVTSSVAPGAGVR